MKTGKKVLIALLSAACMVTGAFGIAACKGGGSQDSALLGVYNEYVANVPSGETPKTYEQWLKDVLNSAATPGQDGKDAEGGCSGSVTGTAITAGIVIAGVAAIVIFRRKRSN